MSAAAKKPVRAWQRMLSGRRLDLLDPSPLDVEITDYLACTYDFNGNAPADTPAAAIEFTDPNGTAHVQYYSMGKSEDWQPAEDGTSPLLELSTENQWELSPWAEKAHTEKTMLQ